MYHLNIYISQEAFRNIQTFEAAKDCVGCGECCKTFPGESVPADFSQDDELRWDLVRTAIASGRWCVDWWEGEWDNARGRFDPPSYFLRPNIKSHTAPIASGQVMIRCPSDPPHATECVFLSEDGCSADIKPFGCKTLKPGFPGCNHDDHPPGVQNSRHMAAIMWKPYSAQLIQLAREIDAGLD